MQRKRLQFLTYVYWSNTFADPGERKKEVSSQVVLFSGNLLALRRAFLAEETSGPVVFTQLYKHPESFDK